MAVYSVHTQGESAAEIADAAFVREGFSRGAFALGPFWLARHRLWLALFALLVVWLLLGAATALDLVTPLAAVAVVLLGQGLLGFEANHLIEKKLARRHFQIAGVVAAAALEEAQTAFFRGREGRAGAQTNP